LAARETPAALVAPVVMVAVYAVLLARWAVGVNVAFKPEYATAPGMATPFVPFTVKVAELIVALFIASLNVALSTWLMGTLLALFAGSVETTTGDGAMVVKVHT
jgi:hypothetical protein